MALPGRNPQSVKTSYRWGDGAVSGLVAGIAMGLLLQFGTELMPVIGGLSGQSSAVRGWLIHLIISILFALLFVAIVEHPLVHDLLGEEEATLSGWLILGLIHGAALGIVSGGIILPLAINILATPTLPFPLLPIPGPGFSQLLQAFVVSIAHLVYGVVLGATYALL